MIHSICVCHFSFSYSAAFQCTESSIVSDVNIKLNHPDGSLSYLVIHVQKSSEDFTSTVILFWDSDIFPDKDAELSALGRIIITPNHIEINLALPS